MKSRKFITILITLLTFFFLVTPSYAQDIEIACGNDGVLTVIPDPIIKLFDESLAPGESVHKTIEVTNNDLSNSCVVSFDITDVVLDEDSISSKYFTSIQVNMIDVFGDRAGSEANSTSTLKDLFDAGLLNFASISVGNTATIDWIVTFDPSSGNEYQAKSLIFDFLLNFQWGSEEDGLDGGATLGASDTRGIGDVLGVTGGAILIPVSIGMIGILIAVLLYKKYNKKDN